MPRQRKYKKSAIFYFAVFVSILCFTSFGYALTETGVFPDEALAIQALQQKDTPQNRKALADVRSRHAVSIYEYSQDRNDLDAYQLALMYAESATELEPENPAYWSVLGQIYAKKADSIAARNMAEDALLTAIKLESGDIKSRLVLGRLLFNAERYSEAIDQIENAVEQNPKAFDKGALKILTLAYNMDFQYERGEIFLKKMLKKFPENDFARTSYSILLHQQGKDKQAEKELDKIITSQKSSERYRQCARGLINLWIVEKDWE